MFQLLVIYSVLLCMGVNSSSPPASEEPPNLDPASKLLPATALVVDSTDDSHSEEPVDAASGNVSAASEDYTEEFDYTGDYADYEGTAVVAMDDSTEDQAAESEEVTAEEVIASDSSSGSYYPVDESVQLTDVDLENLSAEILHSFEQLTPLTQLQLMDLDLMSNEIIDKEVEASEMSELIRNPRQFGSQRFTFSPEPAVQQSSNQFFNAQQFQNQAPVNERFTSPGFQNRQPPPPPAPQQQQQQQPQQFSQEQIQQIAQQLPTGLDNKQFGEQLAQALFNQNSFQNQFTQQPQFQQNQNSFAPAPQFQQPEQQAPRPFNQQNGQAAFSFNGQQPFQSSFQQPQFQQTTQRFPNAPPPTTAPQFTSFPVQQEQTTRPQQSFTLQDLGFQGFAFEDVPRTAPRLETQTAAAPPRSQFQQASPPQPSSFQTSPQPANSFQAAANRFQTNNQIGASNQFNQNQFVPRGNQFGPQPAPPASQFSDENPLPFVDIGRVQGPRQQQPILQAWFFKYMIRRF